MQRRKQALLQNWQSAIAIAQRILLELWRRKVSLICWVIFPISILIVNSLILAKPSQISIATAFAESVPPCLVGTAFFFSCLGGSLATLVAEREQGTLKRILISPLPGTAYFGGIFLAYGSIGLGQAIVIFTIAICVGAQFQGSLALGLLIIVLSMIVYVGTGFCIGTTLARRTEDVNALIAAMGVPLLLLSGAFIPMKFFPTVLGKIAQINPIYHMITALSLTAVQGKTLSEMFSHLLILGISAGGALCAGWLSYRQMLINERKR